MSYIVARDLHLPESMACGPFLPGCEGEMSVKMAAHVKVNDIVSTYKGTRLDL
jgi:hypothetical protein